MKYQKEYFQHDYNARNSLQLQALMSKHGDGAYGIFWAVVEVLHEKKNKVPLKPYIFSGIADQIRSTPEKVEMVIRFCIEECELFKEKNGVFSSTRVKTNIIKRLRVSKIRSKASKGVTNLNKPPTNARKVKESKVKERKIGEESPPGFSSNGTQSYNAEETVLGNMIEFERICIATGKDEQTGREVLHKYHLHQAEKDLYPMARKGAFAGFEKWMRNEKYFNKGKDSNETTMVY